MIKNLNYKDEKEMLSFLSMYKSYFNELQIYQELPELKKEDIDGMLSNVELDIYIISENNINIGFILLGFGENKHILSDWYLAEFYIRPDYRRNGFGTKALMDLTKKEPGKYCLYIIKTNLPAKRFWDHAFREAGYCDNTSDFDQSIAPDGLEFRFYSPKEETL